MRSYSKVKEKRLPYSYKVKNKCGSCQKQMKKQNCVGTVKNLHAKVLFLRFHFVSSLTNNLADLSG